MKIYISGAISGHKNGNAPEFYQMAQKILIAGHEPINPHDICADIICDNPKKKWKQCMKKCITELVTCDAIVMLPYWATSKGARIEKRLAIDLEIPGVTDREIISGELNLGKELEVSKL